MVSIKIHLSNTRWRDQLFMYSLACVFVCVKKHLGECVRMMEWQGKSLRGGVDLLPFSHPIILHASSSSNNNQPLSFTISKSFFLFTFFTLFHIFYFLFFHHHHHHHHHRRRHSYHHHLFHHHTITSINTITNTTPSSSFHPVDFKWA